MFKIKFDKPKTFLALAATQTVFACMILINEIMSIFNAVPGGNYPIEHKDSWARVLLFCAVAVIGFLLAWRFNSKKDLAILPSLNLVFLSAAIPTLASVLSNYLAFLGWCCEQPLAFFFGLPFSFILDIVGFDYVSLRQYENYSLVQILTASELPANWKFYSYQFLLDFLFWFNLVFVLVSLASLLIRHRSTAIRSARDGGNL
jgi:hypothetical protein